MARRFLGFLVTLPLFGCSGGADRERQSSVADNPVVDTGRVVVDRSSLFYESAGTGPTVILLHGGNLDRRMWDAQFEVWRRQFRVIRYDARGYGRSGRADSAFAAHDDLFALMRALGASRASLVGLSLGGRIAIDFALAHPDMVDRLVLAAPGISGGAWADDGDTAWYAAMRTAMAKKDSVGMALAWLGSAYINTAMEDSTLAPRLREISVDQSRFWMGVARDGDKEKQATPPAAARLESLAMPILLIVGGRDTPFISDVAKAIAARAPNVRRVDLPAAGHMLNLEARREFNAAVLGFLADSTRR
ncbi:MAG: alpha/beta fold hydrolase [Gemmatimonadaceae bacterium]